MVLSWIVGKGLDLNFPDIFETFLNTLDKGVSLFIEEMKLLNEFRRESLKVLLAWAVIRLRRILSSTAPVLLYLLRAAFRRVAILSHSEFHHGKGYLRGYLDREWGSQPPPRGRGGFKIFEM